MTTFACEPLVDVQPQSLGITFWVDVAEQGEGYPISIRFTGRRIGVKGKPRPKDAFDVTESIELVVPGTGPLAITTRVVDVTPGEWNVTANLVNDTRSRVRMPHPEPARRQRLPSASTSGATGYTPVIQVRAPGAHIGAWPALVGLGVAVGLGTQALLAIHAHLHANRVLLVSLAASLVGLVGAKFYYVIGHYLARRFLTGHRDDRRPAMASAGMCIQGFVAGAGAALVAGALVAGVPVGRLLDVTAPGLFFGMTIGRFGCFFGGCCAGIPTASRWGLWSSDRRLGVRRIPTQLLESVLALFIAVPALLALWITTPRPGGVVFAGTIGAYTVGRQLLFPLRDNPRKTAHGRTLTMVLGGVVVLIAVASGVA